MCGATRVPHAMAQSCPSAASIQVSPPALGVLCPAVGVTVGRSCVRASGVRMIPVPSPWQRGRASESGSGFGVRPES